MNVTVVSFICWDIEVFIFIQKYLSKEKHLIILARAHLLEIMQVNEISCWIQWEFL